MLLQIHEPGELKPEQKGAVIGIDLGTTHSVVAVVEDHKPRVLTLGKSPLVPSILSRKDDQWYVGQISENVLSSTKRFMGRDTSSLSCGDHRITAVEVAN